MKTPLIRIALSFLYFVPNGQAQHTDQTPVELKHVANLFDFSDPFIGNEKDDTETKPSEEGYNTAKKKAANPSTSKTTDCPKSTPDQIKNKQLIRNPKNFAVTYFSLVLSSVAILVTIWIFIKTNYVEKNKGKALVLNLTERYFLALYNTLEYPKGNVKTDPLTKAQYIAELESVVNDFSKLYTNVFIEQLTSNNELPIVAHCHLCARRELTGNKENENFIILLDTGKAFAKLYRKAKKEKKQNRVIEEIIEKIESMEYVSTKQEA